MPARTTMENCMNRSERNEVACRGARRRGGFTLIEMMLVLAIIGMMAGVAVWSMSGTAEQSRISTTKQSMRTIESALNSYQLNTGQYPPSITVLAQGTTAYIKKVPKDGWKRDFMYSVPGSSGKAFNLYSLGKDGEAGTADDVDVWTMDDENQSKQ